MTTGLTRTEHYVPREDGKVYYQKVGRGEPLIFLHNMAGSGWAFRKVIDQLAAHFTCYNIDLPGYDHSDIPSRQYSIDDFTQAIVDVLDSLGIGRTDVLAAHTGATIAVALASQHPHRVRRMVLDGLPYWTKEVGQLLWEKVWLPQFTDKTSYDIPVSPLTTWEEAVKQNPDRNREVWEQMEEIQRRSRRWTALVAESMCNYDVEAASPKVTASTLLIYGEKDDLRRGEEKAKAAIKGSIHKVVVAKSSGAVVHSDSPAHVDNPEELTKLALDFLLEVK